MSELTTFRDHARRMATAEHVPECPWSNPARAARDSGRPIWRVRDDNSAMDLRGFAPKIAPCPGCVTDADREQWARLAAEVDAYLSHDEEAMLL